MWRILILSSIKGLFVSWVVFFKKKSNQGKKQVRTCLSFNSKHILSSRFKRCSVNHHLLAYNNFLVSCKPSACNGFLYVYTTASIQISSMHRVSTFGTYSQSVGFIREPSHILSTLRVASSLANRSHVIY